MDELFKHSKEKISDDKLEWLGLLLECADHDAANLASTLETLATFFVDDNDSNLSSNETMSNILWGMFNQAATISAMVIVGGHAEDLARERKAAKAK
ncbi:MAG: hypothetical protein EPN17_05775 [Methylobacter sp.]|nr:MAG: hypothetical protein EPN17_05775 [Methylobacter sp.]